MRSKFLYGFVALVVSISIYNVYLSSTNGSHSLLNLYEVEALASSGEDGKDDDEKDQCFIHDCGEGKTCECVMCMRGSVDCSPSCPCCK